MRDLIQSNPIQSNPCPKSEKVCVGGSHNNKLIPSMSNLRSMRKRLQDVSSLLSPRSAGKGGALLSLSQSGTRKVVVAFSGINPSEEAKKFILRNGGDYITSSDGVKELHTITHLVVDSDDLKPRRTKFLVALCVCPNNIVGYDWIEESVRRNTFVSSDQFRIAVRNSSGLGTIEEEYGFSIEGTFNKAISALAVGGILVGKGVYVGPGVMGASGPSRDEVSALLRASGAAHHNSAGVKKMMKKDDVTKLIVITSDKNVPDGVAIALGKGATEVSWADFVTAMLKQEFGFMDASSKLSLIDEKQIIDITQKTTTQQEKFCEVVKILSINLVASPRRSLSNAAIGEPEREFLGPNGSFEIYKFVGSLKTVVRYVDEDGIVKFEALVPPAEDCHKAIQGNAGYETCIFWDTCNTAFASGGTTIQGAIDSSVAVAHRRHFFWFNCEDDLKLALSHMFGQDRGLVDEFFNNNGRFFASEITQPDHIVVKHKDAMEEDDLPVRSAFLGDSDHSYMYDPRCESQVL
eukprot:CAMPEP_0201692446 /NCGR_PEP_ID=MMETSP0578-20130828/5323_1 /ASSEMBLY_ACC=CAM_ASM_000663 /TAXON_ID=267565 /ORGANISM="Skeletonema grethea, Strain CCMP 1804" /LENGTH=519 /DNA_ID=CAMNT_0048177811 /DNA_START=214 /DNA_END=1773 /DNA_ORIENTATION=+